MQITPRTIPLLLGKGISRFSDVPGLVGLYDASNVANVTTDDAVLLGAASSQYLEGASNLGALQTQDFSLEYWVNLQSVGGAVDQTLIANGELGAVPYLNDTFNFRLVYDRVADELDFVFCGYDLNIVTASVAAPDQLVWAQVICTWNATTKIASIYLNDGVGVDSSAAAFDSPTAPTAPKTRIGASLDTVPDTFGNLKADEVRMWNKVLSAGERTSLYASGNGLQSGDLSGSLLTSLVHAYKLGEGSGTRSDSRGTDHLDTLGGTPNSTTGIPSSIPSDGDPINTWRDLAGVMGNATQATSSKKPVYKTAIQNGLNVARFDGVDDWLSMATGATLNGATMFAVVIPTNDANNKNIVGSQSNGWTFNLDGSEIARILKLNSKNVMTANAAGPSGVAGLISAGYAGTSSDDARIRLNRADVSASVINTLDFTGTVTGGDFTLSVGAETTAALAWNITNANLDIAVTALYVAAGYATAAVTVAAGPCPADTTCVVTNVNAPAMTANPVGLTGGGSMSVVPGGTMTAATDEIGAQQSGASGFFTGDICLIAIYNRYLSLRETMALENINDVKKWGV